MSRVRPAVLILAALLVLAAPAAMVPEINPLALSMLRPVGNDAENVRVSPAAGATKWLETSSETFWPS